MFKYGQDIYPSSLVLLLTRWIFFVPADIARWVLYLGDLETCISHMPQVEIPRSAF
jgi:hypothetical protein